MGSAQEKGSGPCPPGVAADAPVAGCPVDEVGTAGRLFPATALHGGGPETAWAGPPLSIAVLVAGTFGDMQPFVVLILELQKAGHRIRLATHSNYQKFVEDQGIEFFPLGGDPEYLSKLMVKNHGFLPAGPRELTRQRREFTNILFSTWDACTQPTPKSNRPFLADCIIANPPSAGHIHCAEKLGVPLHIVFTMPWSPTWSYPHPLSYTRYKSGARTLRNRLSYFATETFIYSGTSDIVQKFRVERLGLEKAPTLGGAAMTLQSLKVPFTYAWSPSLAPKPKDWGPHIDVTGFLFLKEKEDAKYEPPAPLADFLAAGPPPLYIGFGSMVCADPTKMTNEIFAAVSKAGVRAVMAKGWGNFGSHEPPECVCLIEHVPHSWLFPRCSGVVHHGGAGTTAAGALAGRPTFIIPFFGDQSMWGELMAQFGAGPHPIPVDKLSVAKLVAGFRTMATPAVQAAAARLAAMLAKEDGAKNAAAAFHRHLPRPAMLCDLDPSRLARFECDECGGVKLSAFADRVIHEGPLASSRAGHRRLHYRPVNWHAEHELAYQGFVGALAVFWGELTGTIAGPVKQPLRGYCSAGVRGAIRGLGKGWAGLVTRPLRASARFLERGGRGLRKTLVRGGPKPALQQWRYGAKGNSPQLGQAGVAAIENPLQGLHVAALALSGGFISGAASLGAWPKAGYHKAGLLGGVAGGGVGTVALLTQLAGAVVLSAAALLACLPSGIEAAGRQLSCHRTQVGDDTPADASMAPTRPAGFLETMEELERQEATDAPLDGRAAQAIVDRYATWLAEQPANGGSAGPARRRSLHSDRSRQSEVVDDEKEVVPELHAWESEPDKLAAPTVDAPSKLNKRRRWDAGQRRLLCSKVAVRP